MGLPLRDLLARSVIAASLVAVAAGCSSTVPTPTAAPSVTPAGATDSPVAAATEPVTPEPTVLPTPAPPGAVTWVIPCMEDYTCSDSGFDPIVVSWTPSPSSVTYYSLYFTPGTAGFCPTTFVETGPATLVASIDGTLSNWSGTSPEVVGKYSVIAVNDGGLSMPVFSDPVTRITDFTCPGE